MATLPAIARMARAVLVCVLVSLPGLRLGLAYGAQSESGGGAQPTLVYPESGPLEPSEAGGLPPSPYSSFSETTITPMPTETPAAPTKLATPAPTSTPVPHAAVLESPTQAAQPTATAGAVSAATASSAPSPTAPLTPAPARTPVLTPASPSRSPAGAQAGRLKLLFIKPRKGAAYVDDHEVGQVAPGSVQVFGDLTVTVSGKGGGAPVTGVELLVDGKLRASGPELPFTWRWPAGSETSGVHELRAQATDDAGKRAETRIRVAVLGQ